MEAFGYLFFGMVVFLTVFGIAGLITGSFGETSGFSTLWFAVLAWFWFNVLRSPFEARVYDDGWIEFRALARRVRLRPSDITVVRDVAMRSGTVIDFRGGRIWLRAELRQWFTFLTWLKEKNPTVEIRD